MKKIITMIGIGAMLFLAPSCKKSTIIPNPNVVQTENELTHRAAPQQDPTVNPVNASTTMHLMLGSRRCEMSDKQYNNLMLNITSVRVYHEKQGWINVKPFTNTFDLVQLQSGSPVNITDRMGVKPGVITKIAIVFGDYNKLVVNNQTASCFKLAQREVVIDLKGELVADRANEVVLTADICNRIGEQVTADGRKCYILKPHVEFQKVSQYMIK